MTEPRTEIKKILWATNGSSSGMKFFLENYFNMEPWLN